MPVEHYRAERPLEYARRVREGTLDEVLVEKTHHLEDLCRRRDLVDHHRRRRCSRAILMTAFIIWSVFD